MSLVKKNTISVLNLIIKFKGNCRRFLKSINAERRSHYCYELSSTLDTFPTSTYELESWALNASKQIKRTVIDQLTSRELSLFIVGLLSNNKNGLTPRVCQEAFIAAYEETNGSAQELAHAILFNRDKNKDRTNRLDKTLIETSTTLEKLHKNGYAILPEKIDESVIKDLANEIQNFNFYVGSVKTPINPTSPPSCNVAHASKEDIANSQIIKHLSNKAEIKNLAGSYLGCSVEAIDTNLWYTFTSAKPLSSAAQLFHYDLDSLRWLKVFIYLSDVGVQEGPHEYVSGTHNAGCKHEHLLLRRYSRISDWEVDRFYPDRRRKITGSKGTVILADTRCYHKGNNPELGYRLILEFTYAPSTIGFKVA